MTPLFADTFYWIALLDRKDAAHDRALAVTRERRSAPIVTTDEVLVEFLTFFASAPAPLRREDLTDVLTNDRHFEQEGFRALLRD